MRMLSSHIRFANIELQTLMSYTDDIRKTENYKCLSKGSVL